MTIGNPAVRRWGCGFAAWLAVGCCGAAPAVRAEPPIDFDSQVQPLLEQHCLQCHGGIKQAGGLSLLQRAEALAEGDSGQRTIVPGRPQQSELVRRIASADDAERMPADGPPLTAEAQRILSRWIAEGASWPVHWAFQPIRAAAIPAVDDPAWAANPIDRYVLARLEAAGMKPAPRAAPATLVRRLTLDLLGLPPAAEDLDALQADNFPLAYQRLVDRLLMSPHFGERWGRHWLDLARYADTDGYEVDGPRPHAWYWRDWVLDAVNDDLPLDRFTIEQLAGDLLPEATAQQHLATAFHRQTLTNKEGGIDKEEYRVEAVIDRVHTTATVWLGMTMACAQCHDHPYDPITQREFFQWFAFFNNADEGQFNLPNQGFNLPNQGKGRATLEVMTQRAEPRITHIFRRGDFRQPIAQAVVQPGGLAVLPPLVPRCGQASSAPAAEVPAAEEPGLADRLDLARWLVAPENPLPARVAANRIWMHLFGQGLVRTPDNFGTAGQPPTHPELLDWLAARLVRDGWSRKRLIRLIVTSATYQQSSAHRPDLADVDPENHLWHRQNRLRVEAEIVRDLHLAASGLLVGKIGGPSVYPPFPQDLTKIDFRSDQVWPTSTGEDRYRRGMYTFFKRTLPHPNLTVFDCPLAAASTVQRGVSNTPLQALASLNNEVFVQAAQALGRRIAAQSQDDALRVRYAVRRCLGRSATPHELTNLLQLIDQNRRWFQQHPDDARRFAGDALPAGLEPSEAAAMAAVAGVLMNLDEFLTRE